MKCSPINQHFQVHVAQNLANANHITSHHEYVYVYLKRNKGTRSHKGGMSNTKSIQCSVSWNCRRCAALKHYKHLFLLTKWLNYFNANNHKFPLYEWLFSLSAFNSISWPFGWLRWKISVFIMSFYFDECKNSVFFSSKFQNFFLLTLFHYFHLCRCKKSEMNPLFCIAAACFHWNGCQVIHQIKHLLEHFFFVAFNLTTISRVAWIF